MVQCWMSCCFRMVFRTGFTAGRRGGGRRRTILPSRSPLRFGAGQVAINVNETTNSQGSRHTGRRLRCCRSRLSSQIDHGVARTMTAANWKLRMDRNILSGACWRLLFRMVFRTGFTAGRRGGGRRRTILPSRSPLRFGAGQVAINVNETTNSQGSRHTGRRLRCCRSGFPAKLTMVSPEP